MTTLTRGNVPTLDEFHAAINQVIRASQPDKVSREEALARASAVADMLIAVYAELNRLRASVGVRKAKDNG